jgi:parallel beta-helix repeat protein
MKALKCNRRFVKRGILEQLESRTLMSAYFVSNSGSDSGAGTSAAPFASLQKAANVVKAGDTVTVRAGNYSGFWLGTSGTSSAPIIFKADSGATITGKNGTTGDGINLEGASYVTIDGFTINNSTGTINRAGIRATTDRNVTIQNNNVYNAATWGIYTSHADYVLIQNNISHDNNTGTGETWNHHGIYVSNSAVNPTVRGNTVYNNWGNGIHFNGDASQGGNGIVSGALVENNTVYGNGLNGGSAINCDGIQNSTFRNNVLYNNKRKGIALYTIDGSGGSTGNVVVNNTVIQPTGAGAALTIKDGATGTTVRNNILTAVSSPAMDVYADSTSGLVNTNNITSYSASIFVNAGGNDYHLASGAASAIDKGTSSNAPATDHDGNARPAGAGYDIGAYEFGGSIIPTPTPGVPATPTNLAATLVTGSSIKLNWTDNSNNETGFMIDRAIGSGNYTTILTTAAGATSYTDSGLAAGTVFSYRVRARNGDRTWSDPSNTVTISTPVTNVITPPSAPSGLVATASSSSSISLRWTDTSSNETGFAIEQSNSGGAFTQVATVGAGLTNFTVTGLSAGTQYSYRVRSYNTVGYSSYSGTAAATTSSAGGTTTAPASPGTLTATRGSAKVTLAWADKSTNETGFRIDRSSDGVNFTQIVITGANVTSFVDTNVTAGVTYTYRVKAVNSIGASVWTNLASAMPF